MLSVYLFHIIDYLQDLTISCFRFCFCFFNKYSEGNIKTLPRVLTFLILEGVTIPSNRPCLTVTRFLKISSLFQAAKRILMIK